jgi:hypothetical protein
MRLPMALLFRRKVHQLALLQRAKPTSTLLCEQYCGRLDVT